MTSAAVGDLTSLRVSVQGQKNSAKDFSSSDFSQVMNQTQSADQSHDKTRGAAKAETIEKTALYEKEVSGNERLSEKISGKTEQKEVMSEDENQKTDGVAEAVKKIVDEIAGKLDVTTEDVENAMAQLGLTVMDLTNPGIMGQLVTELTEGTDTLSLVTDGNLFAQVSELTQTVKGILDETAVQTQLTPQEMERVLKQLEQASQDGKNLEVNEISGQGDEKTVLSNVSIQSESNGETPALTGNDVLAVETVSEKQTGKEEVNGVTTATEGLDDQQTEAVLKEGFSGQDTGEDDKGQNAGQESGMKGNAGLVNGVVNSVQEPVAAANTTTPLSYVNTDEILKQIGEYVKVNAKPGMTQMEMQLNPENLGSVHIQVTAKAGSITAVITAQNEAVKQALESQVVQLKENLNEQGVKVEAVEVTIESHEFEQNPEQGQNQSEMAYAEELRRSVRRHINLNQQEELPEELTEAEEIQVDMMKKNGNSIDFTA